MGLVLFSPKKAKIRRYLMEDAAHGRSAFGNLLIDYSFGTMETRLAECGLKRISIHVDWLSDYKCIGIEGVCGQLCLDLQIEPEHYLIACAPDEPDEPLEYPLTDADAVYEHVRRLLLDA